MKRNDLLRLLLDRLGPFFGLMLVIALFSLQPDVRESFLSQRNLKIVLLQTVVVGVSALGMTLIIVSAGIDLSVGSSVALSGISGALILAGGHHPVLALLGAVATGAVVGLINGTLIAKLRMAPFIVTLGTLGIARGLAKWRADEQTVNFSANWLNDCMALKWAHYPTFVPEALQLAPAVWLFAVLAVAVSLLLRKTVFGRHIVAVGSNEATARLCGVSVSYVKIAVYCIGGALFGLAGALQMARLRQGDPTVASGLELDVIAAVVIGGASLTGGSGTILGTIIGAFIMSVLRNGSQMMGWPTYMQEIIIGGVIVLAVYLDRFRSHRAL